MAEDEWVKEAKRDDSVVAEVLIRLKYSYSEPAALVAAKISPMLEWGVRQRRSRQQILRTMMKSKEGESTRASPTTPLSWSGGTSLSGGGVGIGGGDGYEEVKRPSGGRSKVTGTNERTVRRSRKKKTFAELKEEESLLLKEKIHLKKELATLKNTFEEQKAINHKLKRMKIDFQSQSSMQPATADDASKEAIYDQSCQTENNRIRKVSPPTTSTSNGIDDSAICSSLLRIDSCGEQQIDTSVVQKSLFELPDLNLPLDEDSGTEDLYGMS